jgi:hypothetical protein
MFARLLDRAITQDVLGAKTEKAKMMTDAERYSLPDGELLKLVALDEPMILFALEAKWFAGIFLLKSGSRRSLMVRAFRRKSQRVSVLFFVNDVV